MDDTKDHQVLDDDGAPPLSPERAAAAARAESNFGTTPAPDAIVPDHAPEHVYVCGGCGAENTTGHPRCVFTGDHLIPPRPGFPLADWLAHNYTDQRCHDWQVRIETQRRIDETTARAKADDEDRAAREAASAAIRKAEDDRRVARERLEARIKRESDEMRKRADAGELEPGGGE